VRTVRLPVPRELAGRELEVEVAGGSRWCPTSPSPRALDDLLRNAGDALPADALVVSVRDAGAGRDAARAGDPEPAGLGVSDALRPSASSESGEPLQNYVRTHGGARGAGGAGP
jgi:hypothetical protein